MATYAAMIDQMDQGIGRILAQLDALDITDDTLIIFLSDNGGCAEFLAEDGWIDAYVPRLPDGRPVHVGNHIGTRPGPADTYMSYDLPWANASNSPFRLYKHWVHEGGISSPCIVHYPNMIQADAICHSPVQFIDVMPTFADLAGADYPSEFNGNAIQPVEGESFLPALQGAEWPPPKAALLGTRGQSCRPHRRLETGQQAPGRLGALQHDRDRTELDDLSASERNRVALMSGIYADWATRCEVRDWPLS